MVKQILIVIHICRTREKRHPHQQHLPSASRQHRRRHGRCLRGSICALLWLFYHRWRRQSQRQSQQRGAGVVSQPVRLLQLLHVGSSWHRQPQLIAADQAVSFRIPCPENAAGKLAQLSVGEAEQSLQGLQKAQRQQRFTGKWSSPRDWTFADSIRDFNSCRAILSAVCDSCGPIPVCEGGMCKIPAISETIIEKKPRGFQGLQLIIAVVRVHHHWKVNYRSPRWLHCGKLLHTLDIETDRGIASL